MLDVKPIFSALLRNKSGLALIVLQVAITLAVVCNSLFIILERSERMGRVSGIDDANMFVVRSLGFVKDYDLKSAMQQDLDMIRSLPGVVGATASNTIPMSRGGWSTGLDTQPPDDTGARESKASALYFVDEHGVNAYGAKLIAGRNFTAEEIGMFEPGKQDIPATGIIVSKALAKKLFPDVEPEGAIGQRVYGIGERGSTVEIIGVVETLQQPWPTSKSVEQSSFIPAPMIGERHSFYVVRTEPGQRDALMKQVEEKLLAINQGRIVRDLKSVETVRKEAYLTDRAMMAILIGTMISLMIVTGLGIVGMASFWVTRRIKQIGTRRALGARKFNIRAYFQTENGLMITMGVVLGVILTYGFNMWLMDAYQAPRLPWYYLPIGAVTVFFLGQLAVFGPANRASKVSPAVATRTA